jgi:hypothetical protein
MITQRELDQALRELVADGTFEFHEVVDALRRRFGPDVSLTLVDDSDELPVEDDEDDERGSYA